MRGRALLVLLLVADGRERCLSAQVGPRLGAAAALVRLAVEGVRPALAFALAVALALAVVEREAPGGALLSRLLRGRELRLAQVPEDLGRVLEAGGLPPLKGLPGLRVILRGAATRRGGG